jgi:glycosyltransferase involved in cell wall biosynthesis
MREPRADLHSRPAGPGGAAHAGGAAPLVLMLLANRYDPDPRVRQEALALIGMGWRVRLLAWDRDLKGAVAETVEGVAVRRVRVRSVHGRGNTQLFFYAWLYAKMLWLAWRTPFDVVHCHDLDTLPVGFIAGKLKRRPVVYDAHESFVDMLAGSVHSFIRRALLRLEDFLIRRADLLITVGEKLRRHFADRGARHAVVVGNWKRAAEYARTAAENAATRRRLGVPDGALLGVCITQLLGDRKIEPLLDAVDACPNVWMMIGGRGALESLVRERAARNPRILYPGFVSGADIPAYTCAGDFVYYGFDPENPNARFSAPNKLFEALAAGKPLVTGDFGEIGEVARAGCGLVLPEYTAANIRGALERLMDPAERASLGRNARRCGESVTWERGEEILRGEYGALIAPRDAAGVVGRAPSGCPLGPRSPLAPLPERDEGVPRGPGGPPHNAEVY